MLIGFFYKHYPNSRLATCVSVIAGSFLCIAGAFITMIIFSGSDMDTGERTAFLIMAPVFAGLCAAFHLLAKWIDARKMAKMDSNTNKDMKEANSMNETTQSEQPKKKKFRFWWIIVGIIALLLVVRTYNQDDRSLPVKLRGSVGDTKTFDCYYIETTYSFTCDSSIPLFTNEYLCKVYISKERNDTDCVYLHISVEKYNEYFGPNATSSAGASGTFIKTERDGDEYLAREYDTPIKITAEIIDLKDKAFNGKYSVADDIESKTGKTKMMDFISISN